MIQKIPSGETYRISSGKATELFLDFIKIYTIEASEGYLNSYHVSRELTSIKGIRMDTDLTPRDIRYTSTGILYLPEFFFKRKLNSIEEVRDMLEEYPILKELLTSYGIFVCSLHDYYESKDDIEIKKIIAHYIASVYVHPPIKNVAYIGRFFNTQGDVYVLEHNLLKEIEILFGKDAIATGLKYGVYSLYTKILYGSNIKLNKANKQFTRRLVDSILELSKLTSQAESLEEKNRIDKSIREKLIVPVYRRIHNMHPLEQKAAVDTLSHKEFDVKRMGSMFQDLEPLTDLELDTIKLYILDFKRKLYEVQNYLWTDFPPVEPSRSFMDAKSYTEMSFTDFNRIITMQNKNRHEKELLDEQILMLWNSLQLILVRTILLPAIKDPYSRPTLSNEKLNILFSLSSYSSEEPYRDFYPEHKVMKFLAKASKEKSKQN